jgi:hypothetical protein
MSYFSENSGFNINISNITAPNGLVSYYRINATDVDNYTYEGENLTYTLNYSMDGRITINSSNGLIAINHNLSYVGNYSILVNVSDDNGSFDTEIMNLSIISNFIPQFDNLTNISCQEGVLCTEYINAIDIDGGENLTMYTNNSLISLTWYNETTHVLNMTYNQTDIGNYSVRFYVRDNYGAISTQNIYVYIGNKNDAPFFDDDFNQVPDNFTLPYIVVDYRSRIYINVTDFDLSLGIGEYVNFTVNITAGPNTSLFNVTKISNNQGLLDFTPSESDMGNYTVYIEIKDSQNASNFTTLNFTVYNRS